MVVDNRSDSLLALDSPLVKSAAGSDFSIGHALVADSVAATLGDNADAPGDLLASARIAGPDCSLE